VNPAPDELAAWLRLTSSSAVTPTQWRAALAALGDPRAVLDTPSSQLTPLIGRDAARALRADPDEALLATIEASTRWCALAGHHCITLGDEHYPANLLEIPDPPGLLFASGDITLLRRAWLALLTARPGSREGLLNARQFAHALATRGVALLGSNDGDNAWMSGLASVAAPVLVVHGGAPSTRTSDAVGLWVSDVAPGAVLARQRRGVPDRLVAGLARAVLVIEAGIGSSPLATARLAAEYGRDVLAIPGSIHSPLSKGCHRLIKEGAKLVESVDDVLDEMARHLVRPN